jgi:hypothetical protein
LHISKCGIFVTGSGNVRATPALGMQTGEIRIALGGIWEVVGVGDVRFEKFSHDLQQSPGHARVTT